MSIAAFLLVLSAKVLHKGVSVLCIYVSLLKLYLYNQKQYKIEPYWPVSKETLQQKLYSCSWQQVCKYIPLSAL